MPTIDLHQLFRLPWTMSDNGMTWLEPTRQCNITCDACFHTNDPASRKSLEQIEHEIQTMLRIRRCDALLIAGGEPLTHPLIVEITKLVRLYKCKPVIITNGVGLKIDLVRELKRAGAYGFTFHIDAHQARPGWKGKGERELNAVRQTYADMLFEVGGLSCSFNVTVFPDTLGDVPTIVEWAAANPDKVQVLTLIAVRMLHQDEPWDYYARGRRINIADSPYLSNVRYQNLTAQNIYDEICKKLPHFRFNAYLGGTALPLSPKWAIGNHITSKTESYGSTGPKIMELVQNGHHFFTGKYLAYTKPSLTKSVRFLMLLSIIDRELRSTTMRFLNTIIHHPVKFFSKLYLQSISVVQPADILPSGETDTCDGCPNKTFWDERLVSACQLEEFMLYGRPMTILPRDHVS